jgi:hypothetical protein
MEMKMYTLVKLTIALATATALVSSAEAATFTVYRDHCNGGEAGCLTLVMAGNIELNDGGKFLELMFKEKPTKMVMVLRSEGGDVVSGLQIGRHLKANGYSTYVDKDALCASSCATIWLAGKNKNVHETAQIAFHAAYVLSKDGRYYKESGMGNAVIGAYYAELGYSEEAIRFFTKAAPDSASYLTDAVAKRLGIAYRLVEEKKKQD